MKYSDDSDFQFTTLDYNGNFDADYSGQSDASFRDNSDTDYGKSARDSLFGFNETMYDDPLNDFQYETLQPTPSFFEYYRTPIVIVAASLLLLGGLLGTLYHRKFTINATCTPEAMSRLRVDAPVVYDGMIIGKVDKINGFDANGGSVRLNLDRRTIPRGDAIFRLEESTLGAGIVVEGGSAGAPLLEAGATVALRERSGPGLNFVRNLVRKSPLKNFHIPWGQIVLIVPAGVLIYIFRKTILFVGAIIVIALAVYAWHVPAINEAIHNFFDNVAAFFSCISFGYNF